MVVLGVSADLLVELAPPSYQDAAPLIPLIALGFAAQGGIRVLNRVARFDTKRKWFLAALLVSGVLLAGLTVLLVGPLSSFGAALAFLVSGLAGSGLFLWRMQRDKKRLPPSGAASARAPSSRP